jgi:hypothetical protein
MTVAFRIMGVSPMEDFAMMGTQQLSMGETPIILFEPLQSVVASGR